MEKHHQTWNCVKSKYLCLGKLLIRRYRLDSSLHCFVAAGFSLCMFCCIDSWTLSLSCLCLPSFILPVALQEQCLGHWPGCRAWATCWELSLRTQSMLPLSTLQWVLFSGWLLDSLVLLLSWLCKLEVSFRFQRELGSQKSTHFHTPKTDHFYPKVTPQCSQTNVHLWYIHACLSVGTLGPNCSQL